MNKEEIFIQLVNDLSVETLFHGHAVIDAEDEAMMVMMAVFNQNVQQILSTGDEVVSKDRVKHALTYIKDRIKSLKPMAYIIGEVYFAELKYKIDERALVPRSPIAELIMNDFQHLFDVKLMNNALDLCTGSGCIGISLAHYFQNLNVDISDLSKDALDLALINKNLHDVNDRVNILESDLFTSIHTKYDLIISNPPYVSEEEYQDLPQEYKQEPKMGLVTQQSGLSIPVKIMLQAPDYLQADGYLILEVGYSDDLLAASFPMISFQWIDFSNGGQGVCVFSRRMLVEYKSYFKAFLEESHVI
jgi:ribosomal protein L3 glutamine methyltransferase